MAIITIDTAKDSKEDIKKAISYLRQYCEERPSEGIPDSSMAAFGIFDSPEPVQEQNQKKKEDEEMEEEMPEKMKLQFY